MTTIDERADKLCAATLFRDLGREQLHRIAELMSDFDGPAGQVLMRSGDAGAGLLIIEEGTVVVSTKVGDVELGPGECLGELALLDDRGKHAARVRAKTDVRGFAIDRDHFTEMLEGEPRIALALLKVLATRLADAMHP